jgi:hypothetical protein
MTKQQTISQYLEDLPTPHWFFRLPLIRDIRWLVASCEQDIRLRERPLSAGLGDWEYFETARIEAILEGRK